MNIENVTIEQGQLHKLLAAGSGDAALLYLYIRCGNPPEQAAQQLRLSDTAFSCAAATLRQLGLWVEPRRSIIAPGERPSYSETDVLRAMDSDTDFRALYGEVQRLLGKNLNTSTR